MNFGQTREILNEKSIQSYLDPSGNRVPIKPGRWLRYEKVLAMNNGVYNSSKRMRPTIYLMRIGTHSGLPN